MPLCVKFRWADFLPLCFNFFILVCNAAMCQVTVYGDFLLLRFHFLSSCAMSLCVEPQWTETLCCCAFILFLVCSAATCQVTMDGQISTRPFNFHSRVQCRYVSSCSGQRLPANVLLFFILLCNAAYQVTVKRNKLLFYKNVVSVHVGCSWTLQKVKYSVLKIRDVSFCPFYSVYTSRNANIYFFILPLKPRWNDFRILCKARLKKFLMLYHAMEVEKNKDTRATFTSSTLSQNKGPHDLEPNICHQR